MSASGALRGAARDAEVRRILLAVLWMNLALVLVKLGAWAASRALSVAAEIMHSSVDATNNLVALWLARVAARAPDARHPYGHQKFETLGALALVGFLSVTVFELGRRAVEKLTAGAPPEVDATPLALGLMGGSAVAGAAVSWWEARRGRALGSDLLLADAAHTRSDVLATVAVVGGLVAVRLGAAWADPWITLLVAGIIARTGWEIVKETVPVLVDERAIDPERIRTVAEATPDVTACYGVRSRGRPGAVFAELTISLDPALDVVRSHQIADEVERRVAEEVAAREVVVHVEPA